MIIAQHITLEWYKDCRGGSAATQRGQFVQAQKLPAGFFDYRPFGTPVHRILIQQKTDGFHTQNNRKTLEEFDSARSLRLRPFEVILKKDKSCEVRYRYDWHCGAIPPRNHYDEFGNIKRLNEIALHLNASEYGRAICNGRFVDYDTGAWWYALDIVNVLNFKGDVAPLDCFVAREPSHFYRQIEQLR